MQANNDDLEWARAKVRRVFERALLALAHELVLMAREVGT